MWISLEADLPANASQLLRSLRGGRSRDIAEKDTFPGIGAFSDQAQAYFVNARALCGRNGPHDLAVLTSFYCIRHGLELWLKCMVKNQILDDVIHAIRRRLSFDEVLQAAYKGCEGEGKRVREEKQQRRRQLVRALCVLRNYNAGIVDPQNMEVNQGQQFAEELASTGHVEREHLAMHWAVPIHTHSLDELWRVGKDFIYEKYDGARDESWQGLGVELISLDKLQAICELFGTLDKDGDAFRYPCSREGNWFSGLPSINLRKLRALASELENLVISYDVRLENEAAAMWARQNPRGRRAAGT